MFGNSGSSRDIRRHRRRLRLGLEQELRGGGGVLRHAAGLPCSSRYDRVPGAEFETGNLTLQMIESEAHGLEFHPNNHPIALHVEDIEATHAELESRGISFHGTRSTPASATWPSSRIRTATRSCSTTATRHACVKPDGGTAPGARAALSCLPFEVFHTVFADKFLPVYDVSDEVATVKCRPPDSLGGADGRRPARGRAPRPPALLDTVREEAERRSEAELESR